MIMAAKKAIVIKTDDIDGDGRKDLSIYADDDRILTIYNLKKIAIEAAATGIAVFCALVGHSVIM